MPNRKRRQARDFKYAHYEEFGTVPTPQPFLEPAMVDLAEGRDISVMVTVNADGYCRGLSRAIETTGRVQDQLLRRDLGRKTMPW